MKTTMNFSPITEVCTGCGSACHAMTTVHYLLCTPDMCMPGDTVKCSKCQCQGWVDCDDDGIFVYWPEDICAGCHRMYEQRIASLTRALRAELMGENR